MNNFKINVKDFGREFARLKCRWTNFGLYTWSPSLLTTNTLRLVPLSIHVVFVRMNIVQLQ